MRPLFARAHRLAVVAALAAVAAVVSVSPSAQSGQLRLVSTAWPPFTAPAGQPRFALDLVEAGLGKMGMSAATTFVDAAKFTPSLLSSNYDGSAAAWKDPDRDRILLFSDPYLENRLVLVGRTGADVSAASLAGLKGKRIAIVEGYSYGSSVENAGPTFVRSSGEEDSVKRLLAGSVDYALMDELVVNYLVEHHAEQAKARLQLGTTPLVTRPLFLAVNRGRADAQAIVTRFNAQLRGMVADRTYHKLLNVEWIKADVDGDGAAEYVPQSDRVGTLEPQRVYAILSPQPTGKPVPEKPGFYIGGNLYRDWASVPESYKVVDPTWRDPRRASASIFRFTWQ